MDTTSSRPPHDGLPVVVALQSSTLAAEVTAHVESVLGWQVVLDGPHLPARLRLADAPDGTLPTVVVARDPDRAVTRQAFQRGALGVLAWPADADRLPDMVPDLPCRRPAGTVLAVAATARGIGASTVALALGALHAWAGDRVVVGTDRAGACLAGVRTDGVVAVGQVPGLSVRVGDGHVAGGEGDTRPDVLVVDRGTRGRGQVLVARPDRGLIQAVEADRLEDASLVVVGEGALREDEVRRLLGGRPHTLLPRSFRVARAGLQGRVPGALPGSYLQALAPLVHDRGRAA